MQAGRMGIVMFLPAMALSQVTGFGVVPMILAMGLLGAALYFVIQGIEIRVNRYKHVGE